MKEPNLLAKNIRYKRKEMGLTQTVFAARLGVTRSALGAYEEGRAEPRVEVLMLLSDLFSCSIDQLLKHDLSKKQAAQHAQDVAGARLRVLSVCVEAENAEEQISIVPDKAAAGYMEGYRDTDFVAQLPAFRLPVPELSAQRTYRLFQIKGDSMIPVPDGAYIIAEYVQDWRRLRDYQSCIVVSKSDGIVFKRVVNQMEEGYLTLKSDNPAYTPYRMAADQIFEVWKALGFISFSLPEPGAQHVLVDWKELVGELRTIVQQARS